MAQIPYKKGELVIATRNSYSDTFKWHDLMIVLESPKRNKDLKYEHCSYRVFNQRMNEEHWIAQGDIRRVDK